MTTTPQQQRIETLLGNLLWTGVLSSLAMIIFGLILLYLQHPEYLSASQPASQIVARSADYPHTPLTVLREAAAFRGQSIIMLGLLMLILTPVLRVLTSIIAFTLQKDRVFTFITALVLAILILAFLLGRMSE